VEALFDGTGWGGWSGWTTGAGRAGGFGMKSGPVWPQPDRLAATVMADAVAQISARVDFTIRITV